MNCAKNLGFRMLEVPREAIWPRELGQKLNVQLDVTNVQ